MATLSALVILASARGQTTAPGGPPASTSTGGSTTGGSSTSGSTSGGTAPGGSGDPPNTYVTTYEGGERTIVFASYPSMEFKQKYATSNGSHGSSYAFANKVRCEGSITATFRWTGPDEPPASAILVESGGAQASTPSGPGSASNGLGVGDGVPKYTIKSNPGMSFTKICDPYAIAISPPGSNGSVASVSYSATAVPVVVTVDGTTNVAAEGETSSYATLIGRGATAKISASGFILSNWSWSADGDKFAGFITGVDSGVNPFNPADLQLQEPHWYWKSANASATVQCTATATIGGVAVGSVTGKRKVNVQKPSSQLVSQLSSEKAYFLPQSAGPINWSVASSSPNSTATILFGSTITLPSDFKDDSGQGRYVQLVGGIEQTDLGPAPPFSNKLDKQYPYAGESNDFTITGTKSGGVFVTDTPDALDINNISQFEYDNEYTMYLLFKPSGDDSEWVPLKKLTWYSRMSAQRLNTTSPWPFTSPNIITDSTNSDSASVDTTDHPIWTGTKQ